MFLQSSQPSSSRAPLPQQQQGIPGMGPLTPLSPEQLARFSAHQQTANASDGEGSESNQEDRDGQAAEDADAPVGGSHKVTRFSDLTPFLRHLPPHHQQNFNNRILQLMCSGQEETPELVNSVLDEIRAAAVPSPTSPPAPTTGTNPNRVIEIHAHLKLRTAQSGTHRLLVKASANPPNSILNPPASAPVQQQQQSMFPSAIPPNAGFSPAVLMQFQASPWPAVQDPMHPWLPRVSLSQVHDSIAAKLGLNSAQYDLTYTDRDSDKDKIYIRTDDDWNEAVWAAIHYSPQPSVAPQPMLSPMGVISGSSLGSTDAANAANRLTQFLFAGAGAISGLMHPSHGFGQNAGAPDTSKAVFVASFTLALTVHAKADKSKAGAITKCGECRQHLDPAHVKYQCTDCVGGFELCDVCFEQGAAGIAHYLGEHVFVECAATTGQANGGGQQPATGNGGRFMSAMGFGGQPQ